MDVHAQLADFALQIVAGLAVTSLVRRHGGQTQTPAQPGPVVPQFHAVPAQRRDPGGLHTAGPAADHHDPAGFPGGADGEGVQRLPARADIQGALDLPILGGTVVAALVARDAMDDVVEAALPELVGIVRIGNERPADTQDVGLAGFQRVQLDFGPVDLARRHDGNPHGFADVFRKIEVHAVLVVHVGYRAHIRIHPGGDTQRGNAQRLKVPCDADGKLHVDAALAQFVPDDAAGDGVVLAHKLAGAADDFRDEAHPGMETAAVAVAPLIGERRHERADQIPVRAVQLAGVKARFLGAAHGLRVIFDILFDLAGFQHPGRVVFRLEYGMGFRLEIGRRDGLKTGCPGIGFPSGMVQLRGDEAIVAVHGLGEPAKAGDAGVVMNKNLSAEVAVRPDAEGADDDHRHPAHGAAFGIGDFRVADGTVFGHVHRHGRHDEPVFKAEGAD